MKWLVMLCLILTLASSCVKFVDFKRHHPGQDERFCNIQKLFLTGSFFPGIAEIDFHYNAKGNPVLIEPIPPFPGDDLIHRFKYDKYDRLIYYEMVRCSPDTIIIFNNSYGYTANPRIIIDTFRALPPPGEPYNPPPSYDSLDDKGRLIQVKGFNGPPVLVPVATFTYDARGNLISVLDATGFPSGGYPLYDSSINMLQTNKVFQFVFQDYSVNNPIIGRDTDPGIHYNAFGLPSKYVRGYNALGYTMFYGFDEMQVQYACDAPHGPGGHAY